MTQNDRNNYEDNRPFLQIPAPNWEMYERIREEERKKEEESMAENSGSVIIIDI